MDSWQAVNLLANVGFILCLAPQLVRTLRLRRADDISLGFLFLVIGSSALMLAYMAHRGEWFVVASQSFNLAVWSTVLLFKVSGPKGTPGAPPPSA